MAPKVHTEFFENDNNPSFGLIAGSTTAGANHNTNEDERGSLDFLARVPPNHKHFAHLIPGIMTSQVKVSFTMHESRCAWPPYHEGD